MAEPQTMSQADVLALIDTLRRPRDAGDVSLADGLDAIAAAVRAACWVEGGHLYVGSTWDNRRIELGYCNTCGQRREVGTEGG